MPIGIRTEGLRKVYSAAQQRGDVVALDGLTLEVQPGEIFGLLGPNGAGKSTTVGIVTTRVQPTAGRAWVGDLDVWKNGKAVKRLIGVVPQRPNLDFALRRGRYSPFTAPTSASPRRSGGSGPTRFSNSSSSPTAPIRSRSDFPVG